MDLNTLLFPEFTLKKGRDGVTNGLALFFKEENLDPSGFQCFNGIPAHAFGHQEVYRMIQQELGSFGPTPPIASEAGFLCDSAILLPVS